MSVTDTNLKEYIKSMNILIYHCLLCLIIYVIFITIYRKYMSETIKKLNKGYMETSVELKHRSYT